MISHSTSAVINKPAGEVFKFVGTDYFTNHPNWDANVVKIELASKGPVGVGTRGRETRKQGGREMPTNSRCPNSCRDRSSPSRLTADQRRSRSATP